MRAAYMQAYRDIRRANERCLDCPATSVEYARCRTCRRKRADRKWRNSHPEFVQSGHSPAACAAGASPELTRG